MPKDERKICQSCAMPLKRPEDFGTDAGGKRNGQYCRHCFVSGRFTDPSLTLEMMIRKLVGMADMMNMTPAQADVMAREVIPKLKRWAR